MMELYIHSHLLLHGVALNKLSTGTALTFIQFVFPLGPLLGSSLPYWSTGLITQFLDLSQEVGPLGRVISSSQGLYLNTEQHKHRKTRTHIKHPCPVRDSNPQSLPPSDRRLFMPQTSWIPLPATFSTRWHVIILWETSEIVGVRNF
jgi:hypothetical protein